jgi:hypothetical protein
MYRSYLSRLTPFLFVLGCGQKSDEDRLKDLCMSPCEAYVGYIERCSFELGVATEDYCEEICSDQADDSVDMGCEDEYEAVNECSDSISWADAECSEEGMARKLIVCAEQGAAWMSCLEAE